MSASARIGELSPEKSLQGAGETHLLVKLEEPKSVVVIRSTDFSDFTNQLGASFRNSVQDKLIQQAKCIAYAVLGALLFVSGVYAHIINLPIIVSSTDRVSVGVIKFGRDVVLFGGGGGLFYYGLSGIKHAYSSVRFSTWLRRAANEVTLYKVADETNLQKV